ncbi:hypothetical protein [Natrinema soli]|uniref:Uncharacterized protein n=1 Tax=Natrinema soli TaxID=1930624 RepID=A0ABD5SEX2_9EURY|nr:hypothetical protein [Natrinema soli]
MMPTVPSTTFEGEMALPTALLVICPLRIVHVDEVHRGLLLKRREHHVRGSDVPDIEALEDPETV